MFQVLGRMQSTSSKLLLISPMPASSSSLDTEKKMVVKPGYIYRGNNGRDVNYDFSANFWNVKWYYKQVNFWLWSLKEAPWNNTYTKLSDFLCSFAAYLLCMVLLQARFHCEEQRGRKEYFLLHVKCSVSWNLPAISGSDFDEIWH